MAFWANRILVLSDEPFLSIQFVESINFTDGCYHVYLDVGSNIGVQIRKLFEPHLYRRGAKILGHFEDALGPWKERNQSSICAMGFEPNPQHTKRLTGALYSQIVEVFFTDIAYMISSCKISIFCRAVLQRKYRACGWRVYFHAETAVGNKHSRTQFFR